MAPLRPWTVERAITGAFAAWFLPRWPDVGIDVDADVDGWLPHAAGMTGGELLKVIVSIPWGRPDPRGPERETRQMNWHHETGRWVKGDRTPMQLVSVFARDETVTAELVRQGWPHVVAATPRMLDEFAAIAVIHAMRELERGYAVTSNSDDVARFRQEVFGHRKQLPRVSSAPRNPWPGRCTGACCVAFPISTTYDRLRDRWPWFQDGDILVDMLIPLEREHADELLAAAGGAPIPEVERDRDRQYFTCRHFDSTARKCMDYDARPRMCRTYPDHRPCEHCGLDLVALAERT